MSDNNRIPPSRNTFARVSRQDVAGGRFFIETYTGAYERFDGAMSKELTHVVFERGDSVAALLHDVSTHEVILTEQFRLPVFLRGVSAGWMLEPAAGMVREDETPRQAMQRELKEETGFQLRSELVPIATFFVSPGGTTERISLFYAEVRSTEQVEEGGGVGKGEDIHIERMQVAELFARLRNRELEDAKLIIAAQWLRDRLATTPLAVVDSEPEFVDRCVVPANQTAGRAKVVGYVKGDILRVRNIDVWVNPLSTDMMLDRFTDRTVSAAIRRGGAEKFQPSRRIKRDTIGEALRDEMGGRYSVNPAVVLSTPAGELTRTNGVKRIFHVAVSKGEIGEGPGLDKDTLDKCVDNVLAAIDVSGRYRSVVVPIIGTGEGGFLLKDVVPRLLRRVVEFLRTRPQSFVDRIYLLPYTEIDADIVEQALDEELKTTHGR